MVEEILQLCNAHDVIIRNILEKWKELRDATCHTYNNQSAVDYKMISTKIINKTTHFTIYIFYEEMSFEHDSKWIEKGLGIQCTNI